MDQNYEEVNYSDFSSKIELENLNIDFNYIEENAEKSQRKVSELSIEERLDLASKTYSVFDPFDFYEVSHKEIDKLYPVPSKHIIIEYKNETIQYYE